MSAVRLNDAEFAAANDGLAGRTPQEILRWAVRQFHPVSVYQRDHGQHERIDREFAHPIIGFHRIEQLPGLAGGERLGGCTRAHQSYRHQAVPLCEEPAHFFEREIARSGGGITLV